MSGRSRRRHAHVVRHFFTGLDGHVLHLAVLQDDASSFVQGERAGDFVPVFFDYDANAGIAALFLIVVRQEDDVPR